MLQLGVGGGGGGLQSREGRSYMVAIAVADVLDFCSSRAGRPGPFMSDVASIHRYHTERVLRCMYVCMYVRMYVRMYVCTSAVLRAHNFPQVCPGTYSGCEGLIAPDR